MVEVSQIGSGSVTESWECHRMLGILQRADFAEFLSSDCVL